MMVFFAAFSQVETGLARWVPAWLIVARRIIREPFRINKPADWPNQSQRELRRTPRTPFALPGSRGSPNSIHTSVLRTLLFFVRPQHHPNPHRPAQLDPLFCPVLTTRAALHAGNVNYH